MADEKPFDLPDLKDSIGIRLDEQAKKDIYILMASQRETRVSNIIKWALAQQAAPPLFGSPGRPRPTVQRGRASEDRALAHRR